MSSNNSTSSPIHPTFQNVEVEQYQLRKWAEEQNILFTYLQTSNVNAQCVKMVILVHQNICEKFRNKHLLLDKLCNKFLQQLCILYSEKKLS